MRLLILGGGGMLGHKLAQSLGSDFETWVTLRGSAAAYNRYRLVDPSHVVEGVDVQNLGSVIAALAAVRPEVVINCIGIVKQLPAASDPILSLTVNALLPHRLQRLCLGLRRTSDPLQHRLRLQRPQGHVHRRRPVRRRSTSTAAASSSARRRGADALTIRTSIIGRELSTAIGLLDWFLAQNGRRVQGYRRAIYSGFTTHGDGPDHPPGDH